MVFAHDTEVALAETAALINTHPDYSGSGELLPDIDALDAFVRDWGWTGRHDRTSAELAAVRSVRPQLAQLWELPEEDLVNRVNQLLAEAQAVPQLTRHDGWSWHLHATTSEAPLATRMTVDIAMALVDVVRAGDLTRLGRCAAADCSSVLVDLSKNRSRRYCDSGCGNRANVAAYRARRSGAPDASLEKS